MTIGKDNIRTPLEGGLSCRSDLTGEVTLGVFAKHWTPGHAKTRLAGGVGERAAAELSRLFLEATLRRLSQEVTGVGARVLAYSPEPSRAEFGGLKSVRDAQWKLEPQPAGDLGQRMKAYFGAHGPALLLGSDSPNLPLEAVEAAAWWLGDPGGRTQVVLGPSEDGGYWLIGCRTEALPIFDAMPWSQPRLLEATLQRLEQQGWKSGVDFRLVDRWYDIDTVDDLNRLRSELVPSDPALGRLAEQIDSLRLPDLRSPE